MKPWRLASVCALALCTLLCAPAYLAAQQGGSRQDKPSADEQQQVNAMATKAPIPVKARSGASAANAPVEAPRNTLVLGFFFGLGFGGLFTGFALLKKLRTMAFGK